MLSLLSVLVPLFCSSGERAIVLVFVHWHAEVLLREGRFMAELQVGICLKFFFLLSRQLYLAASSTKETRRVCTLPLHRETDPRLDWLQEHAGVIEKLMIQWGHFYTGWQT